MSPFCTRICLVLGLVLLMSEPAALGQSAASDSAATSITGNPPPPAQEAATQSDRVLTDRETLLSCAVLAFGLIVVVLQLAVAWQSRFGWEAVLKLSTTSTVVAGTLFIITSGFSSEQIAPSMGLFGTITGYLLGRETRGSAEQNTTVRSAANEPTPNAKGSASAT